MSFAGQLAEIHEHSSQGGAPVRNIVSRLAIVCPQQAALTLHHLPAVKTPHFAARCCC
jgi:hypothetical protein